MNKVIITAVAVAVTLGTLAQERSRMQANPEVNEMQVIVDEMLRDREQRIEASMARFTDSRFRPGLRDRTDAFLPVLGAKGNNVSIVTFRVVRENGDA